MTVCDDEKEERRVSKQWLEARAPGFSDLPDPDRLAIFGYCGDTRQWQHDLNVGFVPAGPPRMLVHWNHEVPAVEQARLIERVAALGPF